MQKCFFIIFISLTTAAYAQLKTLSWNIENFGSSKSDSIIIFIANTVKEYDIVALQEVVAGDGGAKSVARLAQELNRTGSQWDYTISDPTSSSAYKTERYAFLWKTANVRLMGKPWLEKKYNLEIDREPYLATFEYNNKQFTLANFHAITKSRQPETEIKYFKFLPAEYPTLNLVFIGDFNCPQSHTVFNPLRKMGWKNAFENQKTSLRKECEEQDCLASEFDNIWYDASRITLSNAKAIHFYNSFESLKKARKISDHIPITAELMFK